MNEIDAEIKAGIYEGDPIRVEFGRPLKIYCRGKDVSDAIIELHIEISRQGQIVHLVFAELSSKQLGVKR